MRSVLLVLVMLAPGCATTGAAPPVREPCPPAPIAQPAPAPQPPSKADITEKSHTVIDAYYRGDHAVVEALLDEHLLHFEGGGPPTTRNKDLEQLKARKPGAPFIAKREWSDEVVAVHADEALFFGKATETQGGNDSHGGGYRWVGYYTLQWRRVGDAWKVRLWSWQRGGATSKRETWNDIYRNAVGFEKQPNKLLVEIAKTLKPGTALDLAMGQGRNALYLASQGWTVTGIDFADEGIKAARDEAAKRKLVLTTINADIDSWDFGKEKWDLISMIYPGDNHDPWIEKAKVGLKKGGTFVLEYFAGEPDKPDDGYVPGHLAKLFPAPGFVILRDDYVEGQPDWAMDHAKLVRFVAKKK
jgi:hypothetical protein